MRMSWRDAPGASSSRAPTYLFLGSSIGRSWFISCRFNRSDRSCKTRISNAREPKRPTLAIDVSSALCASLEASDLTRRNLALTRPASWSDSAGSAHLLLGPQPVVQGAPFGMAARFIQGVGGPPDHFVVRLIDAVDAGCWLARSSAGDVAAQLSRGLWLGRRRSRARSLAGPGGLFHLGLPWHGRLTTRS